jgi:putative flippase GtrA
MSGHWAIDFLKRHAQVLWFLVVGAGAALVHLLVVILLVNRGAVTPLLANIGGWLVAFVFSFSGHYWLTFARSGSRFGTALRRFFVVSAVGFALNEATYAIALKLGGVRYDVSLFIVLILVAIATFFLSRRWAFFRI